MPYQPPPYVALPPPQLPPPPYLPPPYLPPPPPVYQYASHLDYVDERLSRLQLLHGRGFGGDVGSWRRPPDCHSTRITTFVATLPRPASRHRARPSQDGQGGASGVASGVGDVMRIQARPGPSPSPGPGQGPWDARPGPHTFATFAAPTQASSAASSARASSSRDDLHRF